MLVDVNAGSRPCRAHRTQPQDRDWQGRYLPRPICFECLPAHRATCPQRDYLESAAFWYGVELARNPRAFELRDGVDARELGRILERDAKNFESRFGTEIPPCRCGRYRQIRVESNRPFQQGLTCALCSLNGNVRTWTGREIRTQLAPALFAARLEIADTLSNKLSLDAHAACVAKLAERAPDMAVAIRQASQTEPLDRR